MSILDAMCGAAIERGIRTPAVFRDESRARLVEIATALRARDGIDGLILGGTELPLLLREPTVAGVPVLDPSRIHVDVLVDWLLDG